MAKKVLIESLPAKAGELLPANPAPLPARRLPLDTVEHVRREAARVYRQMRAGTLPAQEGARLIWALGEISKLLTLGKIEARLLALENATVQQFSATVSESGDGYENDTGPD